MKRTGEITLGIIGIILSALTALMGMLFMFAGKSEDMIPILEESLNDPTINSEGIDLNIILNMMSTAGSALIIAAILGVVLGLIGVIAIKGNKKPKLAGLMFIIGAVLIGVITIGFGFLPALLFLIAGIMCFARKPSLPPPSDEQLENI
ncbi:DUF4064 domain-containing protein [Lederbergia panacisoli]|uniref:DUF4064 domain-containing protein n=1 Tax=Lederbergia panacisoli TaxID=1255251 RepID=UPI00214CB560|nr:DUF4064 domain-containing protein [Lederbergia panacisoli]MCR2820826.1 DUF4064 domain-containing protein [Lederbergia panacisoli]